MKAVVGLAFAGAMLGMIGVALADEVSGTVKAIDAPTRRITLEDGKVYTYIGSQIATVGKLKIGDKVKITFEMATPVFVSLGIYGSATKIVPST
jgi:hypothetical protein